MLHLHHCPKRPNKGITVKHRMYNIILKVCSICIIITILSCNLDNNTNPEGVARKWQALLDSNKFEDARRLSTEKARQFIDMIEDATRLDSTLSQETFVATKFLKISCTEKGDTAYCACIIEVDGEQYPDTIQLVRSSGAWLVDIKDVSPLKDEEDINDILDQQNTLGNDSTATDTIEDPDAL